MKRHSPRTSTRVVTRNADGDTLSVTGTAATPEFHTYGVANLEIASQTVPCRVHTVREGSEDSARFTTTYENMLGQTVREERSGFRGALLATVYEYDSYGRLVRVIADHEPVVEYAYDSLGDRVATTRTVWRAAPSAPQGGQVSVSAETEWRRSAVDVRYVVLDGAVWLAQTNTVSCSDPLIAPLVTSTARQLTGLSAAAPSRSTATDERGNATETWTAVNGSIVTRHRRVPYATNVAETTLRYGDVVREISVSGVTDTYAYDALGRQVSHADGRGNTSRTEYNVRGLRSASIDALGNRTAYAYDRYGNLSAVTNPLGNAVVYEYDLRGRRTYEGGATYPVRYTYDVFGNKTTMTTYRNESLGSASGDVTTWRYDEASNCMTNKVYADGKGPRYGYTQDGKLAQRIWARGIVTDYSYDGWGSLTNTVYSDGTPTVTLLYDAMGRQTNAVDAAGVTTFRYDDYGSLTNETVVGAAGENTIIRHWDSFGRTTGYSLVGRDDPIAPQRHTTIGYDSATGRIATMLANGSDIPFTWSYLPGSDLKSSLAYPNGLTASWTYDANSQLLQVRNAVVATAPSPSETEVISQYDYVYDNAGRRVSCAKSGSSFTQNDALSYGYNEKSELTNAVAAVDSDYRYAYDFDEIGNRESANERGTNAAYMANQLNQYTAVDDFTPQFDDDGNQTLVKTATGIWTVAYNGENRPVLWTCGATSIVMKYDRMGRRVEYLETVDGGAAVSTNRHHRFVYDGYLCVQRLDASAGNAVDMVFAWDALEKVATKPLMIEKPGMYKLHVTHDGNKNVSELVFFSGGSGIAAHYEYAPFGAVTASTRSTSVTAYDLRTYNPFRFSSEYADDTLGLVYYNYRHYNPLDGRWTSRDPIGEEGGLNVYIYVNRNPLAYIDTLGLFAEGGDWCTCICGFFQMIGGGVEAAAGYSFAFLTAESGIGIAAGVAVGIHGSDVAMAGFYTMVNGVPQDTLTSQGLQAVGVPQNWANGVDKGISMVGTMGVSAAAMADKASIEAIERQTELVQRAMSRAEVEQIAKKGVLCRGGRPGNHYVRDAVNTTANRARQRLALPVQPEVRVILEVPKGVFSAPTKVQPYTLPNGQTLPGGGMERIAPGNIDVPARIISILNY